MKFLTMAEAEILGLTGPEVSPSGERSRYLTKDEFTYVEGMLSVISLPIIFGGSNDRYWLYEHEIEIIRKNVRKYEKFKETKRLLQAYGSRL